jgi:hypothetical protein
MTTDLERFKSTATQANTGGKRPTYREPFLQIPIRTLVDGSNAVRSVQQFLVWLYIHYRVWADKRRAVEIANRTLKDWGVDRRAKYKALRSLEAAGLIALERQGRHSPRVTLL